MATRNLADALAQATEAAYGVVRLAADGEVSATDVVTGDDARLTAAADLAAHLADASAAHDASAIAFTPAGTIAATTVQAAIEEVASEAGGGGHEIQDDGTPLAQRAALNFVLPAGSSVADDAGNDATVVTIAPPASEANQLKYASAGVYLAAGHDESEFSPGTDGNLHVFASDDGIAWREIVGAASYTPPSSGVVRDPSIIRYGNRFYVAHTARLGAFDVIASDDLIAWEHVATVTMPSPADGGFCWAPELFLDGNGVLRCYVTASPTGSVSSGVDMQLWETHPSVEGVPTAWSTPAQLTVSGAPASIIDACMVRADDGTHHLFYKDETSGHKWLNHATSTDPATGFAQIGSNIFAENEIEGFSVCRVGAHSWRMYYNDVLGVGIGYRESRDDFATWGARVNPASMAWSHSTVILSNDTAVERHTAPTFVPLTTAGDIPLADGPNHITRLAKGAPDTYLGVDGAGELGYFATSGIGGGGGGPATDAARFAATGTQAYTSAQYPPANKIGWATELTKTGVTHSAVTANDEITIITSGTYVIHINTDFGASIDLQDALLEMLVNGSVAHNLARGPYSGLLTAAPQVSASYVASLTAGDVATFRWYCDGGTGTLNARLAMFDLAAI